MINNTLHWPQASTEFVRFMRTLKFHRLVQQRELIRDKDYLEFYIAAESPPPVPLVWHIFPSRLANRYTQN